MINTQHLQLVHVINNHPQSINADKISVRLNHIIIYYTLIQSRFGMICVTLLVVPGRQSHPTSTTLDCRGAIALYTGEMVA